MKVWENLEKLLKHLPNGSRSQCFLFSQTSTCVSMTQQKHSTCFLLNYQSSLHMSQVARLTWFL